MSKSKTRKTVVRSTTSPMHHLLGAVIAMIVTALALMGSYSLPIPGTLSTIGSFLLGGMSYGLVRAALKMNTAEREYTTVNRLIASLIVFTIALAYYAINHSFYISPFDMSSNRFAYHNIGVGSMVASWLLILILTTLQKDRFWPNGNRTDLDEREQSERRRIFELTYKFALFANGIGLWLVTIHFDNLPRIESLNGGSAPSSIVWLLANHLVLLIALPQIIAAWRKR